MPIDSQSICPMVPTKINVVRRNMADERPIATFLTEAFILIETSLGRTFGRTRSINPERSGTRVIMLRGPVKLKWSPP